MVVVPQLAMEGGLRLFGVDQHKLPLFLFFFTPAPRVIAYLDGRDVNLSFFSILNYKEHVKPRITGRHTIPFTKIKDIPGDIK